MLALIGALTYPVEPSRRRQKRWLLIWFSLHAPWVSFRVDQGFKLNSGTYQELLWLFDQIKKAKKIEEKNPNTGPISPITWQ